MLYKGILCALFVGLLYAGDSFGAAYHNAGKYCKNNANATCSNYCGGGITPGTQCWNEVTGGPCDKVNAEKCYVKCICNSKQDAAYWIADNITKCKDGYDLKNGKCEKKSKLFM